MNTKDCKTADPVHCACKTNACTRVRGRDGERTRGYCPCRENGTACTYLCRCGDGKYGCVNTDYIEDDEVAWAEEDLQDPPYKGEEEKARRELSDDEEQELTDDEEVAKPEAKKKKSSKLQQPTKATKATGKKKSLEAPRITEENTKKKTAELSDEISAQELIEDEAVAAPAAKKKKSSKSQQLTKPTEKKTSAEALRLAEEKKKRNAAKEQRKADIARITSQITQLSTDDVQTLVIRLVNLHPDLVDMAMGPDPPEPAQNNQPDGWCHCHRCREMPTLMERKCCIPSDNMTCILVTEAGHINQLVLSRTTLEVGVLNHNQYCIQNDDPRNNRTLRHMAYRKYILWRLGYLGTGIRVPVASCVVWAIRDKYPSENGRYTGFKPF